MIDAAVDYAVSGGSGPFDGTAGLVGGFVEVFQAGFGLGAAAEAPTGSGDFEDESLFEEVVGRRRSYMVRQNSA